MTFGEKLQVLRKSRGLSQEQLAEMLQVSRQAVSKWELNASKPDADKVVEISRCFSVSTDYLLKDEMASPEPPVQPAARDNGGRQRTILLLCLGVMALAALLSAMAWNIWHSWLPCGVAYMAVLGAWLTFEILVGREPQEKRLDLRLRFYAAADWLLVMPVIFILFQTADNTIAAHADVETFGIIAVIGCILLSANCCNYLRKR